MAVLPPQSVPCTTSGCLRSGQTHCSNGVQPTLKPGKSDVDVPTVVVKAGRNDMDVLTTVKNIYIYIFLKALYKINAVILRTISCGFSQPPDYRVPGMEEEEEEQQKKKK